MLCIIDSSLVFIMLRHFNEFRINIKSSIVLPIIIIQGLVIYFISGLIGDGNFFSTIISLISFVILFKIVFDSSFIKLATTVFLSSVFLAFIEFIGINLSFILFNVPVDFYLNQDTLYFTVAFSIKIIVLLVILISLKFSTNNDQYTNKSAYQTLLVAIMNLMIAFIVIWIYQYIDFNRINVKVFISAILAGIIVFTSISISLLRKIQELTAREIQWEVREHGYLEQTKNAKNFSSLMETIKSQQHDFKIHLNTLNSLLNNKCFDEAINYITEVDRSVTDSTILVKTSSTILSSVLSLKYYVAKNKEIEFIMDIYKFDDQLLNSTDFTIIMGNIIDNAIEASEKVKVGKKYMNLKIYEKNQYFCIFMSNSKNKGTFFKLSRKFSTKENQNDHGYGLSNVRYVVEKYNGFLSIKDHGNQFDLKIYIPIKHTDLCKIS